MVVCLPPALHVQASRLTAIILKRIAYPSTQKTQRSASTASLDHLRRHRPTGGLSYLHNASNEPLSISTVPAALVSRARNDGDREACAFLYQNIKKTYGQLNSDSDNVARGLVAMGFKSGDRIALWGPNSYEWLVSFFGITKIGAIATCLNPGLKANEVEYSLNKVGAVGLFAARAFRTNMYYPSLEQLFPTITDTSYTEQESSRPLKASLIPTMRHVFALERQRTDDVPRGLTPFDTMLDYGTDVDVGILDKILASLSFDNIVNIQFTSGTTGAPKAVQQSHFNVVNNCVTGQRFGMDKDKIRLVSALPFFHSFAMTSIIVSAAVNGYFFSNPAAVYDAVSMLKAIESEKCNVVMAVPTMVFDLLNNETFDQLDLSSLKSGATVIGAAPCPPALAEEWLARTGSSGMIIGYGMTESAPAITCGFIDDNDDNRCNTIGYPLPHVEVKIASAQGSVVPLGQIGEICTRGYNVMQGYWQDEKMTNETIMQDGWLKTGDLGSMTPEGYVRIEGRKKEMIIRGGENVYPAELENILLKHEAVKECYVIGVAHERLGEEICAVVRTKIDKRTPSLERELRTFFHSGYAAYKVPRYYWILDDDFELPTTTSGKVQKLKLKELATEKFASGVKSLLPTVNESSLHGADATAAGQGLGSVADRFKSAPPQKPQQQQNGFNGGNRNGEEQQNSLLRAARRKF